MPNLNRFHSSVGYPIKMLKKLDELTPEEEVVGDDFGPGAAFSADSNVFYDSRRTVEIRLTSTDMQCFDRAEV